MGTMILCFSFEDCKWLCELCHGKRE